MWAAPLSAKNKYSAVLFNRSSKKNAITAYWSDIGIPATSRCAVRDLWLHEGILCGKYYACRKPKCSDKVTGKFLPEISLSLCHCILVYDNLDGTHNNIKLYAYLQRYGKFHCKLYRCSSFSRIRYDYHSMLKNKHILFTNMIHCLQFRTRRVLKNTDYNCLI